MADIKKESFIPDFNVDGLYHDACNIMNRRKKRHTER
jgi:hypothetical protein